MLIMVLGAYFHNSSMYGHSWTTDEAHHPVHAYASENPMIKIEESWQHVLNCWGGVWASDSPLVSAVPFWGYLKDPKPTWLNQQRNYNGGYRYPRTLNPKF